MNDQKDQTRGTGTGDAGKSHPSDAPRPGGHPTPEGDAGMGKSGDRAGEKGGEHTGTKK